MLATRPTVHGKRVSSWKQEQAAKQAYSNVTFRQPSFWLYKDDPKHRAVVTVYLTLVDGIPQTEKINAVITHHRTERRYSHISVASLRRLSALSSVPLLSADQFAALDAAAVAQEMLDAAHAQQEQFTVKGVPALPPLGQSVDVQAEADLIVANMEQVAA